MNKLMFMLSGMIPRLMAEAGSEGGGGGETTTPPGETTTPPGETTTPPGETKPGETKPGETTTEIKSAIEQKSGQTATPPGETKPGETTATPKEVKDEDYLKAMVADEATKKAAGDDKTEISQELAKRMLPALREAGLNPEQSAKLANVFAREQIAAAVKHREEVAATMKEMNDAAFKQYPEKRDWDLIGAARDHFFKQDGTMSYTIAKSFLGSDKEFLALLHFAGEKLAADDTPTGGAAGAGKKPVNYAKALGIE